MDGEIGRDGADEPADSDVLHDRRVDPRGKNRAEVILRVRQLVGEDEGVERDITTHAAAVQKFHQRWQIGLREVFGPHPRVETLEPEINCIGAILDRGPRAFPIACGRQ